MAGHSRPKDGVLSHAYVPAMTVGFGDSNLTARPRESGYFALYLSLHVT
jgi:hypothetical protein